MRSTGPLTLVLATANVDKAAEIGEILGEAGVVLLPRPSDVPDVEESGATLLENARLKAVALRTATSEAAVADDTGLFVEALAGAPGVYSSRFAGGNATYAENVAKLLLELEGVEPERRQARFVSVALVSFPDGSEFVAEGAVDGLIAPEARGSSGFGYDPLFVPHGGGGRTFAEMSPREKHAYSHRGRAFRALAAQLDGRSG